MTHSETIKRKFWRLPYRKNIANDPVFWRQSSRFWCATIILDVHNAVYSYGRTQAESCARAMAKMKEQGP